MGLVTHCTRDHYLTFDHWGLLQMRKIHIRIRQCSRYFIFYFCISYHFSLLSMQKLFSVAPYSLWPSDICELYESKRTFKLSERVKLTCFLFGNGADSPEISRIMRPHLRDTSARNCVTQLLGKLQSTCYATKAAFYYFDVNSCVYMDFNGEIICDKGNRTLIQIEKWNKFVWTYRNISIQQCERFFAQTVVLDPISFFRM